MRIQKKTYGPDICCSEDRTGYSRTPRLLWATVCEMWAVPACVCVCVCTRGLCSSLLTALQQSNDTHSKPALLRDAVSVSRLLRGWRNVLGWQEGMKSSCCSGGRRWHFMSVNSSSLWRSDWGSNSHLQHVCQGRLNMWDRNRTVVISLSQSSIWSSLD